METIIFYIPYVAQSRKLSFTCRFADEKRLLWLVEILKISSMCIQYSNNTFNFFAYWKYLFLFNAVLIIDDIGSSVKIILIMLAQAKLAILLTNI